MLEMFLDKAKSVWDYLFIKGGLFLSALLTFFLSAIGYPKTVIYFIMILMVADVLTRWYTIVKQKYDHFNIVLFFQAWRDKELNSKKLKMGVFTKIFFYAILLIIAHQCSIVAELAFGDAISNFIYSTIVILDCSSILENMIDSGFTKFKPLLKLFKNKYKELSENTLGASVNDENSQG